MYRLSHRGKTNNNLDISTISKSKSQYLKENMNPNCFPDNSQKNQSFFIQRKSLLTKPQDSSSSRQKIVYSYKKKETPRQMNKTYEIIQDEDFIKPQDIGIGINNKGVQNQLQNAMKRQIQKQKMQIKCLNQTVSNLKSRDKAQQNQIKTMKQYIDDLVNQIQEIKDEKYNQINDDNQNQQVQYLKEQNKRLNIEMIQMQEMIKTLLLQREKQKTSNSNQ